MASEVQREESRPLPGAGKPNTTNTTTCEQLSLFVANGKAAEAAVGGRLGGLGQPRPTSPLAIWTAVNRKTGYLLLVRCKNGKRFELAVGLKFPLTDSAVGEAFRENFPAWIPYKGCRL
jgi:hypothetical protein